MGARSATGTDLASVSLPGSTGPAEPHGLRFVWSLNGVRDRCRKGGRMERDDKAGLGVAQRDDEPRRRGGRLCCESVKVFGRTRWQPADELRRHVSGEAYRKYQVARSSGTAHACAALLDRLALGRVRRLEGDENHERASVHEGTRAFERQRDSGAGGGRRGTTDLEDDVHEPAGEGQARGLLVTHCCASPREGAARPSGDRDAQARAARPYVVQGPVVECTENSVNTREQVLSRLWTAVPPR